VVSAIAIAWFSLDGHEHVLTTVFVVAAVGVVIVVLVRNGILSLVTALWACLLFLVLPVTNDASQWYAPAGFAALAAMTALVIYAFAIATPTRGLLGRLLLEQKRT
jgi:hypothetical protein